MNVITSVYNYDFSNLNILECGACKEGEETRFLRDSNNCYYIEANPNDFKILSSQHNINKENIFNFALTDYCGDISFTITSWSGNSSVNHSIDHHNELVKYGSTFNKITVPCYTYKYFIEEIIKKPIDLLVLDIEGHECTILNSMRKLSVEQLPKIICIEAGYDWHERKKILKELEYNIDYYYFNNVFLTHNTFNISKNIEKLKEINNKYPNFIWQDKLIFENDSIYR